MESVLVGVDHSEPSRRALRFALKRARVSDWRVHVVHVINWSRWYDVPTLPQLEGRPIKMKEEQEATEKTLFKPLLELMGREDLLEGLELTTSVHFGRPSEVLSGIAGAEGFDIVVVARTGDWNLKQAIFGSTASRLVQHAPVPVVVVP
ncbi:universal stress protein [Kocuria coralli]|uniref:Universal stress protein n=1 Tax=Kocuria coralli TaxID=1461025 RepID=A0A5J5KXE9_9MICC|nr:universal stress protein [Kocuria coralli]KAA9394182.1 universal stress protein [Kocuria coralli]